MDNHSSSADQDPVTQAAEFFVEFRAGDATPAVRARFEKWLRSSPENVQAYLEIAAGWSELPTSDPECRIDLETLLEASHTKKSGNVVQLNLSRARVARSALPGGTRHWVLAGSVALVLMTLACTSLWIAFQSGRTYKTSIGEQRTLILADGSLVSLNALTTLRVHMTRETREVTLVRGQAYFHDTDDPSRPFIVRAGNNSVRAIGTEFDVDEESDQTVITVLEGRVAVANSIPWIDRTESRQLLRDLAVPVANLKAAIVSAGEQVTVSAQNIPPPKPVDVTGVTAWREQRLVFDDTPLKRVAELFNLYSSRRLVIADQSLLSVGISGVYSASDPDALIGFLRSQPTLRVTQKNGEFIVSKIYPTAVPPSLN